MKKRWMMFVGRLLLVTMLFTAVTEPVFAMPEDQEIAEEATEVAWEDDLQAEEAEAALEEVETIPEEVSTEVTESGEELSDDVAEEPASEEDLLDDEVLAETADNITFTIEAVDLMYGEDGSNENGNLDRLFAPHYLVDGVENADVQVSYKFFLSVPEQDADAETIRDFLLQNEGENLADIPAESRVLVAAFADDGSGNDPVIATQTITITKRKLIAHLVQSEDLAVSTKEMPEEETVSIGEQDEAYQSVTIEVVENRPADAEETIDAPASSFAHTDEISENPADVIEGEITLDVSDVDTEQTGFQEVPAQAELAEELTDNYELSEDMLGYIYVEQPLNYITITAVVSGKLQSETIWNSVTSDTALKDFPGFVATVNEFTADCKSLIEGWTVYRNGVEYAELDTNYKNKAGGSDFKVEPKQDYCLIPKLSRNTSQNLFVDAIPAVEYDGRSHVCKEETLTDAAKKSKVNDLELKVFYLSDADIFANNFGAKEELRYGIDYKVTFKNNKAASVHYGKNGELLGVFESNYDPGELKKRPCATITGNGNYKGLTATVYFDILPRNFGQKSLSNAAQIENLKGTYALKNGKVSGINPKVTMQYEYATGKITLTKGKDYMPALYRYDDMNGIWDRQDNPDPNKITTTGRYLYVANGINNFCGTAFGQKYGNDFRPLESGSKLSPKVCEYTGSEYMNAQFIVQASGIYDLANATITIGKKSLPYEKGKYYGVNKFKIVVKAGNVKLEEGVDYDVVFDGTDYDRPYILDTSSKVYYYTKDPAQYKHQVFMANKYRVKIVAPASSSYYGAKDSKQDVQIKGIKINPKWFKFDSTSIPFDGTYNSGGTVTVDYKAEVSTLDPSTSFGSYLGNHFSSSGIYQFYYANDYVDGMEYVHNTGYGDKVNKVMLTTDRAKLPGTYNHTVHPVGPAVDHDALAKVQFKRTPITVTEALNKNYLKISMDPTAVNNAGGALPGNVKITFAGNVNSVDLQCNSQSFEVADPEGTKITLKLDVTNNKKTGTGYINITGDGKVLKGKATKAAQFVINPTYVTSDIECLEASDYQVVYGKCTDTIHETTPGTLYAIVGTAQKTKNGSTPVPGKNITLCQSYYKNESDADNQRASLATIPAGKYKLLFTEVNQYKYNVAVSNGTGGDYYFYSGIKLLDPYTVYGTQARITGIEVNYYELPDSYPYPDDVLKFPEAKNKKLPYTGARYDEKKLEVKTVYLKVNGMDIPVGPEHFTVEYGDNLVSGKGTIKVILKYSSWYDTFLYGGNATFNFTIDKGVNVTM